MTAYDAMNRLAKWRTVFASWQLGSRLGDDGECRAVKDHREATILLRAEVSALTSLLAKKGVFTKEQLEAAIVDEVGLRNAEYEKLFPGFTVDDDGVHMKMPLARQTMHDLGFPQ